MKLEQLVKNSLQVMTGWWLYKDFFLILLSSAASQPSAYLIGSYEHYYLHVLYSKASKKLSDLTNRLQKLEIREGTPKITSCRLYLCE